MFFRILGFRAGPSYQFFRVRSWACFCRQFHKNDTFLIQKTSVAGGEKIRIGALAGWLACGPRLAGWPWPAGLDGPGGLALAAWAGWPGWAWPAARAGPGPANPAKPGRSGKLWLTAGPWAGWPWLGPGKLAGWPGWPWPGGPGQWALAGWPAWPSLAGLYNKI